MEFRDVVRRRQMVRNYTDDPVDPMIVDRMLAHAVHAPSAGFSQGWGFLLLDQESDVRTFWQTTTPEGRDGSAWLAGMSRAPVVIVPWSCERLYRERYAAKDKLTSDQEWRMPYWHLDTAMASLLILQTAVDEGVGACFFGIPAGKVDSLRWAFGVSEDREPIGAITVGHVAPGRPSPSLARGRRPLDEVVHRGRWSAD